MSPSARYRTLLSVIAIFSVLVYLGRSFLGAESFTGSRQKLTNYFGATPKVDEIYGLLHLVTKGVEQQYMLTNMDPTKPVDFSVYSGGRKWIDWEREVQRINTKYPVVVFSKSYCPYSKRAKNLLASYNIRPAPYIVEVDLRDDGSVIKGLLTRLTNRTTFPNILVRGHSIGGSDELFSLHEAQELREIFEV